MGKYSDFPRKKHDAYQTPFHPVTVLAPHLAGVRTFAEPCFGDGNLVRHLAGFDKVCTHYGDIKTGQDALTDPTLEQVRFDAIITNPPYTQKLLDPMIERFMSIAPTWLLLEADWKHNVNSARFIPHCSLVVSVGRVKWFEDTEHTGKTNYAWYRFHSQHTSGPGFVPRVKHIRQRRSKQSEVTAHE